MKGKGIDGTARIDWPELMKFKPWRLYLQESGEDCHSPKRSVRRESQHSAGRDRDCIETTYIHVLSWEKCLNLWLGSPSSYWDSETSCAGRNLGPNR
jgi:hypothetical protein